MRNSKACVSDPNTFFTCSGEEFKTEYSSKVKPDGTIELVPSGKIDIKQMINSQREQTDIAYIVKQIENGNYDVINPGPFYYGDSTAFPQTYAEMLQLRIDAEKSFYELPVDVRKKFDNDFNRYFASAGTEAWAEKLGLIQHEEVKEESVTDES